MRPNRCSSSVSFTTTAQTNERKTVAFGFFPTQPYYTPAILAPTGPDDPARTPQLAAPATKPGMSELQRRWAKAKMEMRAAGGFDEAEEEREVGTDTDRGAADREEAVRSSSPALSSSSSSLSSTGTVVPSASKSLLARPLGPPRTGRSSMEPIPWTAFFERELFLAADNGSGMVHHAYLSSPVFAGGSGEGDGPLFVMHHGAGSTALSFAVLGAEIRKRLPAAGILSVDARGHGGTRWAGTDGNGDSNSSSATTADHDLSLETLSADLQMVVRLVQADQRWPRRPGLVLVGHSMGGAVVADVAASLATGSRARRVPSEAATVLVPEMDLLGYAVLDVVEGSAMDALASMHTYLATRPAGFASVAAGIEWHLRSRTLRNTTSARTSVPALLVDVTTDEASDRPWHWRTDLAATQPFWEDWFRGLSKKFLGGRGGKLLLLAGTDRLDTELMIGQMQGKYALQVFPEAGHFVHEDVPEKTATVLVDFYHRNNRSALVLPPKVSELLAQGKRV